MAMGPADISLERRIGLLILAATPILFLLFLDHRPVGQPDLRRREIRRRRPELPRRPRPDDRVRGGLPQALAAVADDHRHPRAAVRDPPDRDRPHHQRAERGDHDRPDRLPRLAGPAGDRRARRGAIHVAAVRLRHRPDGRDRPALDRPDPRPTSSSASASSRTGSTWRAVVLGGIFAVAFLIKETILPFAMVPFILGILWGVRWPNLVRDGRR